jgi:hypothetical protein
MELTDDIRDVFRQAYDNDDTQVNFSCSYKHRSTTKKKKIEQTIEYLDASSCSSMFQSIVSMFEHFYSSFIHTYVYAVDFQ